MNLSSEDASRIEFAGTNESYDRREVEDFRRRVIAALEQYEAGAATIGEIQLAQAQRVRQQAVHMAEKMLRDVIGSSGDEISGLETWQEAAMLRALAEEEMEYAREESRRLPAMAIAERDEIRTKYAEERRALRVELHDELQVSRAAADDESERIRRAADAEATRILTEAIGRVEQTRNEVHADLQRGERRLALLKTALADAESRFRRLAATAANEAGTLAALADQDIQSEPRQLEVAVVDLTDGGQLDDEERLPVIEEPVLPRGEEAGFYQRRLAGLRDRLEKSGHPPQ